MRTRRALVPLLAATAAVGGVAALPAPVRAETTTGSVHSAPGGRIAFIAEREEGNPDLFVMDDAGDRPIRLVGDGDKGVSAESHPSFSPDGTRMVFGSDREGTNDIWAINLDGTGLTRLTSGDLPSIEPTFSPDGTRIAFTGLRAGNADIYVMDADGRNRRQVTTADGTDYRPAWSPDGSRIAFTSLRDSNADVYIVDATGGIETRLTETLAFDTEPAFSPDGRRIAFSSTRGGSGDIWTMNIDGGNLRQLTSNAGFDMAPAYSPDGSRIVFESDCDGDDELYVLGLDSNRTTKLTINNHADVQAAWGVAGPLTPVPASGAAREPAPPSAAGVRGVVDGVHAAIPSPDCFPSVGPPTGGLLPAFGSARWSGGTLPVGGMPGRIGRGM